MSVKPVSPVELVICNLRSYQNTYGCCGQDILLGDTWSCSELMPVSTADGNNHAYDRKIFQASGRKGFPSRSNSKGGGGLSFTGLYVLHMTTCYQSWSSIAIHSSFNPALQCWVIWGLTGIHVFCAIVLLSPKGPFQAFLCCYCTQESGNSLTDPFKN